MDRPCDVIKFYVYFCPRMSTFSNHIHSLQVWQNNLEVRAIHEKVTHVNGDLPSIPSKPPEPPDVSKSNDEKGKLFFGFLHLIIGVSDLIMTIPVQVKQTMGRWATQVIL